MEKIFELLSNLKSLDRQELKKLLKDNWDSRLVWVNDNGLIAMAIGFFVGSFGIFFWKITLSLLVLISLGIIFLFLFTPNERLK